MPLRDLFAANANLLRDPDRFGEVVTLFDQSTTPPTQTPFDGILEILGNDPLLRTSEEEALYEQGTIDVPTSIAVDERCYFMAGGLRWNFIGRGGRDNDLQTISVQCAQPRSKKTANRRGS